MEQQSTGLRQQTPPSLQHSRVLLIDDQPLVAELVGAMLQEQENLAFEYTSDASEALSIALAFQPTVILADLKMPTIDGFGILRRFRKQMETAGIPIILLSGEDESELKVRGFDEGANDYLVKWPHHQELIARIRYHSSAYLAHRERDAAYESLRRSQEELLIRTRELAESQAALHQVQKMEAIGKLTGGIAHDFNNVLQIISSNLQLLKFDIDKNQTANQRITAALEGVTRGAKLASQLLAFARRQPLRPVVINPAALLSSMDQLLRRAVGDATEITTKIADGLWNTLVDPNQLENVILNLALNARDAIVKSGRLEIHLTNVVVDAQLAGSNDGFLPGEYIGISLIDNGSGMPPEVRDRAFEPFFTTKPSGKGTGLGLSMAYGFVKQSGGHIELQSVPGQGTAVTIYLPRAENAALAPTGRLEQKAVIGGNEKILIVEDEPQVRAATAELLEKLGYSLLQAEDAQQALWMLESGEIVDLIFSDVIMPGPVLSTQMADRAKKLLPDVQILFASGYTDSHMPQCERDSSFVNLLTKPYSGDDLARKLDAMLAPRRINRAVTPDASDPFRFRA